jgi:hypothetical protein
LGGTDSAGEYIEAGEASCGKRHFSKPIEQANMSDGIHSGWEQSLPCEEENTGDPSPSHLACIRFL